MLIVRRARERHCLKAAGQHLWLTFYPGCQSDALASGFGDLMALNEGFLAPDGNMLTYSRGGARTLTYVVEGLMKQKSRGARSSLIGAGGFQCSSAEYSERSIHSNASDRVGLHVLQVSLFAASGREPAPQVKHFSVSDASRGVGLVGSADGRGGSLALGQDALVYCGLLKEKGVLGYPLAAGRLAWLQVLRGQVAVGSMLLGTGDGAGFSLLSTLSMTASVDSEVLLLDLAARAPRQLLQPRSARAAAANDEADVAAAASGVAAAPSRAEAAGWRAMHAVRRDAAASA